MPLSLLYALPALAILLIVFLVVNRLRGLTFALVTTALTLVGLFALYVVMVSLIIGSM